MPLRISVTTLGRSKSKYRSSGRL